MIAELELKAFGAAIQRLINKQDLAEEESYALFRQVLRNEQPDLQQGAFLAALVSKGETTGEIVGAWQAIRDFDTIEASAGIEGPIIENSGTGMDSLKTFNVSSAAAIVASACGAKMVRHGARALTSFCGTVDILEALGLDVECDPRTVERSLREVGIGLFNGMSARVHPGGLGRILSQIRFGSTLNIAASLANPIMPTHGLRGVYSESLVEPVGKIMAAIGYVRGMVVYGKADGQPGGMDELSVCGDSVVFEFSATGGASSCRLRPEDAGLRTFPFAEIATTGNLQAECERFLGVLAAHGSPACTAFTCLNAGATLYIGGLAKSITEGVLMAQDAIASGAAIEKLRRWVAVQNSDPERGIACLNQKIQALKPAA
ncbi:MAG: anthranilate phosphoribosyltransferase [Verrucomicrobiae bacterium]